MRTFHVDQLRQLGPDDVAKVNAWAASMLEELGGIRSVELIDANGVTGNLEVYEVPIRVEDGDPVTRTEVGVVFPTPFPVAVFDRLDQRP